MKAVELRQKSKEELRESLAALEKRAAEVRFEALRKKMKNVKELMHIRRDIARVLTLMKEK
ncbi:MAG: 50S ribosomal protein L29 [Candidatus Sungbacteria bacterium]|uniref:Large ribosomal subunit protein uL29 n=1 Tax=Candidatus Sungiibacteriota bacterium TaxID=2750080 RepID=A0A931SDA0_9BACT|nr:50S ribosomal protein L29 [Candidatus Sungbacteria bacterium]